MKKTCLNIIAASCAFTASAFSAERTEQKQQLDEVVVTATRTERKTDEVAAGISTVGRDVLNNSRMFGIKEGLTGLSGVQSDSKNGGYDSRLIIRGAGLKALYGVREIMVLLDGVPITDPDGMTRFDFVDTQTVDRIDVVKGPNSTLYGANAAGGVVNILTRSPFEEINSLKVGYGSDNTQIYNALVSVKAGESTALSLSGTRKSTDGWREWNKFDSTQFNVKAAHMVNSTSTVDLNFSYTDANIQLPGTLTKAAFEADPAQLTSEAWRHSGRYSKIYNTSIKLESDIGSFKIKPVAYYQNWEHYHPVTGLINDGGSDVYGTDIQGDWKHSLLGNAGTLTVGVAGQIDTPKGSKYLYRDVKTLPTGRITATLSDASGSEASHSSDTISKWGVYAQESIRVNDAWLFDAGIRLDQVFFDLSTENYQSYDYATGKYKADRSTTNTNKDFTQVSPRIGAVYKINTVYSLYGTVATGFQTPQSSELDKNPGLTPVKTINYETGARARFDGGHSFDASVFYLDVKDEVVLSYLAGGDTTYNNAGSTIKKGFEFAGKYQLLQGLFLGGTYTYSDFQYDTFKEALSGVTYNRNGNQLPYVPKHQYNMYAFYKHSSGFKAKIDSYTWGKYYVDNANSATYGGYNFLTNAMVGYENKNWDITFDVNNVFDKQYAMEVTKDTTGTERYRPGAPISVFGKVAYKF
ncbi:MAG: TonB-dependent receptor [Desulfuromonadaceae bacterium]|nr:TonB-dependent receptor [Desulfuromonadaceae bacterium]